MAPTDPARFDTLSAPTHGTANEVLAQARALQRAALAGQAQALLRGKNLGLLCAAEGDAADAALFRRAATELGAHVAHIRASLADSHTAQEVQHTARLLSRLYDAVECQGLPTLLVQQFTLAVDVPVLEGLACPAHPSAAWAEQLDLASSALDRRMFVVQAVLLRTLA